MRINTIGTPVVTQPERSPEVGATRPVSPVQERTPQPGQSSPRPALATPAPGAPLMPVVPAEAERRREVRRGKDRRKQQVAVLVDTRVAQRRAKRRRAQDAALPSIDVEV
jgi:hypothetical protein